MRLTSTLTATSFNSSFKISKYILFVMSSWRLKTELRFFSYRIAMQEHYPYLPLFRACTLSSLPPINKLAWAVTTLFGMYLSYCRINTRVSDHLYLVFNGIVIGTCSFVMLQIILPNGVSSTRIMDQNVIVSNCQITLQGLKQAFLTLENFHKQACTDIFK